jgi:hypothetical protein
MLVIYAQDTIEHLNLFSVPQAIVIVSMFGRLDVLLLNYFLGSHYFPVILVLINLLK